MKKINEKAAKTFNVLISKMNEEGYAKIENNKSFMAVIIERIETGVDIAGRAVDIYSLAHYYKSEGDLIADPEMTFAVSKVDPLYIWPMTFQTSFGYRQGIHLSDSGQWLINASEQADEAVFAGMWLKNIKMQQNL